MFFKAREREINSLVDNIVPGAHTTGFNFPIISALNRVFGNKMAQPGDLLR